MRFPAFTLLCFAFPHYDRSFFALNGALAAGDDQKCSFDRPCSLNNMYPASKQEEVELDLEGGHYEIHTALVFPSRKLKINGAGARIRCVAQDDNHIFAAFDLRADHRTDLNASIFDVVISGCLIAFIMGQVKSQNNGPVNVAFRNVSWIDNDVAVQISSLSYAHFHIQDCAIRNGDTGFGVKSVARTIFNFSRTHFFRTKHAIRVDSSLAPHVRFSEGHMIECSWACIELARSFFAILEVDLCVFENSRRGISIGGMGFKRQVMGSRFVVTRTQFDRNQAGFVTERLGNAHVVLRATKFIGTLTSAVGSFRSRNTVMTLYDCEFHRNQLDAIKFFGAMNMTISVSHCSLSDNAMRGLMVTDASKIKIEVVGCNFNGNVHQGFKFVSCNNSTVDVDRCVFQRSRIGMLIDSSENSTLHLTKSNFTHNLASGLEILYSEASLVVDVGSFSHNRVAGVHVVRRNSYDDECENCGHVEFANVVVRNNSLAGVLLEGLRINARFTDSSVDNNQGVGVNFDGGDTGSSSFKRCEILRNPLGSRFRVEILSFQDSVIFGSEDGIKIDYADAVALGNVTIADNRRGVSCSNMHLSKRPTRKHSDWTATGFIYFNTESDVNCGMIQRVAFVPNFITRFHYTTVLWNFAFMLFITHLALMLPPVLGRKPVFKTPRSIRDWWPPASWSYRIVTSIVIVLWGILAATMLLFLQVVQYTPSDNATRVSWMATSIILLTITMGCTGRLVSEMVMRKWTLMSATWSQTQEQKILLKKKLQLQKQIRNVELKRELAALQDEARRSVLIDGGNSILAEGLLRQMKSKAEEENRRLGAMAKERRFLYDSEACRMAYLLSIPSEKVSEPVQEDVGVNQNPDDDEGFLRYIHEQAEWFLPEFSHILRKTVYCFNRVGDVHDLESIGLLPEGSSSRFRLSFEPEAHKLKPDRHATALGIHCGLKIGGVKRIDRALAKARRDYCNVVVDAATVRPVSRHVCDWLRATVITEDPYTLALLFHVFKHVLGLVRVKNNFANSSVGPIVATNLLSNFKLCRREHVHVVEIQFLLQDFLSIKLAEHDYYEILRAESMRELCAKPIFDAFSDDEEEEDLMGKMPQSDFFSKVMSLRNQSNGNRSVVRVSRASVFASVPTVWGTFQSRVRASRRTSGDEDGTEARSSPPMAEDSLGALRLHLADESTQNIPDIELAHVFDRRASISTRMSSQSFRSAGRGRSESNDSISFPLDV